MTTDKKQFKQASKRSASHSPIEIEQINNYILQTEINWSDDYEFLSLNEIYMNAIGIIFSLTTKCLINTSFINLYQRSLQITWMNLLNRERRNLKANVNSVEKCFMINRLIAECKKDPCQFARQTGELYEEIKMRISCTISLSWTIEDFYRQVELCRNLQSQRRLFHINYEEANRPHSLLTLQQIATKIYSHFLSSCQRDFNNQNYNHLKKLLQHSFIIIDQPSVPECVAATKYDKMGNTYSAKLHTRIICLLEPDIVEKNLILSNVVVTLFPFDRNLNSFGEQQKALKWQKKQIIDSENILRSFFYIELESIELQLDQSKLRPIYNAKICQLEFQIKIQINGLNIEENLRLISRPFGICSHAQYYPEYVAQVLLYEVEQISQSNGSIIQPNILTNYIARYYTRISGVETKFHTIQYITDVLQRVYGFNTLKKENIMKHIHVNILLDASTRSRTTTSFNIYQDILAKLISQIEMFVDYPFLSMMYHDGLFLGICNNALDQQLHGTQQQPHMLLRFNSLIEHQSTQNASIRFIIHNGQLTRATFHTKAFIDEMCHMICKANSCESMSRQFQLAITNHNELFRLDATACQINDTYQPLIPVLWDIMRISTTEQVKQTEQQHSLSNSFSFDLDSIVEDMSQSRTFSMNEIPLIIQTDILIHHLVEQISNLLMNFLISNDSTIVSILTNGNIQQQKQLLFHLLNDYFQSKTNVDVATQTSLPISNNSSDSIFNNT
ncbi:unnamed protein product [Rotaria sordida]|uniref:Uncharacterized protein n=1 Tax=Rotaria sordida TaxID=392033 RepID=A0A818XZ18_9BILA|nr:unnamed protein product [Rotaria sordida]